MVNRFSFTDKTLATFPIKRHEFQRIINVTFFLQTLKVSFHDFSTADQIFQGTLSLLYHGIPSKVK